MLDAEAAAATGGLDMAHDQLVVAIRDIYLPEKEAPGVFAVHLIASSAGFGG
ncbi:MULTISPECIES: hypothetical protein [Streptomyces]|uniref:hypothetical protein n=1 Tax=Streptomyces TaxID=1883 RepID=UPI00163C0903|nr:MULTISPECIES: hypothetical protein [Streptomyces]MBC2879522.1 hypothetical protein [Streptomyces sp. TYQ1024]UBI35000.1 hypothetical protein K7I03_00060 [Streptomyces mobaraensis]UKW27600.1 hypothetical protein MCU78_00090 [Streptomyces sp. TYQ1024]